MMYFSWGVFITNRALSECSLNFRVEILVSVQMSPQTKPIVTATAVELKN